MLHRKHRGGSTPAVAFTWNTSAGNTFRSHSFLLKLACSDVKCPVKSIRSTNERKEAAGHRAICCKRSSRLVLRMKHAYIWKFSYHDTQYTYTCFVPCFQRKGCLAIPNRRASSFPDFIAATVLARTNSIRSDTYPKAMAGGERYEHTVCLLATHTLYSMLSS